MTDPINLDAASASRDDRGWQRSPNAPARVDIAIEMANGESSNTSWIREWLQLTLGTGYLRRRGW